ncbi:MAG: phosphoglycerate dehydrogenase [Chitinophagales bacterium]
MSLKYSYPKEKIKVLLLENIHSDAYEMFASNGFQIDSRSEALSEEDLCKIIQDIHILGIRSKTHVSNKVVKSANKLLCIGAFCIGTNQIDISACNQRGIAVFNAPYSNTRSVVELALGEIILLMRNVINKSQDLHLGKWDKTSENSFEVRGKTLVIIGYGHIGSQLSVLAEAIGMKVLFYDIIDKMPLGNAQSSDINELLHQSDVVSLHIDGRKENHQFINADYLDKMKEGSIFLNLSRGYVVDYFALKEALLSRKIIGAGIDVFPDEPKSNGENFHFILQNIPNVILTPHIGGSTEEAQSLIGRFVPNKILNFINNGSTDGSVNFPSVQLPTQNNQHRILHIHRNVPGILAKINQVIASNEVNITGQYLKTNEEMGYVIMDIEGEYPDSFFGELKSVEHTIKCRILY